MKRIGTILIVLFFIAGMSIVKSQTPPACDVPTNLNVSNIGKKSATITWSGTSDSLFVLSYRIVDPNINYNWHYRVIAKGINFLDLKPLIANTTYEVQIRAYCYFHHKSSYTDPIQFKTTGCQATYNLTVLKVTDNQAKLKWDGSADYFVVRYVPTIGNGSMHYKKVTANNITIGNLATLTQYTWSIKAVCISTDTLKAYTTGPQFTTQGCTPPSLVVANNITYKSANIIWNKNPDALSYIVKYYYDNPDSMVNHTHYKKTTANNRLLKLLYPNSKYIVQVGVFCSSAGTKDSVKIYGDTMSFVTLPKPWCLAPDGLTASAITSSSARLKWNTCPIATNYRIKYSDNSSLRLHYVNLTAAAAAPYFLLGNLRQNLTYTWQVYSYYTLNGVVHHTDYSTPATFNTTKFARLMSTNDNMDVQLYPNPSNGVFTLNVNSGTKFDVQIFNMTGKLIHSESALPSSYTENINLQGNPQGVYFIRINNGNEIRTSKLVIQ